MTSENHLRLVRLLASVVLCCPVMTRAGSLSYSVGDNARDKTNASHSNSGHDEPSPAGDRGFQLRPDLPTDFDHDQLNFGRGATPGGSEHGLPVAPGSLDGTTWSLDTHGTGLAGDYHGILTVRPGSGIFGPSINDDSLKLDPDKGHLENQHHGVCVPASGHVTATPEPGAVFLVGAGLAGMLIAVRKRNAACSEQA